MPFVLSWSPLAGAGLRLMKMSPKRRDKVPVNRPVLVAHSDCMNPTQRPQGETDMPSAPATVDDSSPFPQLFGFDEIERAIPHDPTVDLPLPVQPPVDPDPRHAMERRFPHIVDRIMLLWGTPMCGDYIRSLVIMDRNESRQGFPVDLIEDLLMLDYCHSVRMNGVQSIRR